MILNTDISCSAYFAVADFFRHHFRCVGGGEGLYLYNSSLKVEFYENPLRFISCLLGEGAQWDGRPKLGISTKKYLLPNKLCIFRLQVQKCSQWLKSPHFFPYFMIFFLKLFSKRFEWCSRHFVGCRMALKSA